MTTPAPFFADLAEAPGGARTFWAVTEDGRRIRTVLWGEGRRGTAVIFQGRSEYVEKYGRVVARLVDRGFAVLAFDWRGQGLSTRSARAPGRGHVEDFREYQRDWAAVRAQGAVAGMPRPLIMFAHSMGACIGLRSLVETRDFDAAVFSAPMWRLQMRAFTRQATTGFAQVAALLGLGGRRMPGTKRQPSALAYAFERNSLTSCAEHFAWFGRQLTAEPGLGLAGPSLQWTYAALGEMTRLAGMPAPELPVLTLLGTEEVVVSPAAIRMQMARLPQGRLVEIEGARHEIWMERPAIQERVWGETDRFLANLTETARPSVAHG